MTYADPDWECAAEKALPAKQVSPHDWHISKSQTDLQISRGLQN
jgi:hypothetical protein